MIGEEVREGEFRDGVGRRKQRRVGTGQEQNPNYVAFWRPSEESTSKRE